MTPDPYRLSKEAMGALLAACRDNRVQAILEFGSGASTAILADHVPKVVSLEQNPAFLYHDSRVHYVFSPLLGGFYRERVIRYAFAQLEGTPRGQTAVVVDGPVKARGGQRGRVLGYLSFLRDRVVLVDDTHRADGRAVAEGLTEEGKWAEPLVVGDALGRTTHLFCRTNANAEERE